MPGWERGGIGQVIRTALRYGRTVKSWVSLEKVTEDRQAWMGRDGSIVWESNLRGD